MISLNNNFNLLAYDSESECSGCENNFEDLIEYNIKFLKGEIKATFYHCGPTDPETEPLLPDLIKINKYGFFSDCGQPSLIKQEPFEHDAGKIYLLKQKSFISGYIENNSIGLKLINFLKNHSDVY